MEPARTTARRTRSSILAALVVVGAALIGVLVYQSPATSSSTAASPVVVLRSDHHGAPGQADGVVPDGTTVHSSSTAASPVAVLRRDHRAALGEADGVVPDGTTVFDDKIPGVARLDQALLSALRQAATEAAGEGVEIFVDSGWRSPEYQEQLLQQAISTYGSATAAARWVATPDTSAHVTGDAVDIGPSDATAWLSKHGAKYGLCQIYSNEPWHYERRPDAIDQGCPPMYADPTHDPRMEQGPAHSPP
ncbi:MAG: M15 family metallopeptidase [Candidatus Limnocylindrales bacterium]